MSLLTKSSENRTLSVLHSALGFDVKIKFTLFLVHPRVAPAGLEYPGLIRVGGAPQRDSLTLSDQRWWKRISYKINEPITADVSTLLQSLTLDISNRFSIFFHKSGWTRTQQLLWKSVEGGKPQIYFSDLIQKIERQLNRLSNNYSRNLQKKIRSLVPAYNFSGANLFAAQKIFTI